MLGGGTYVLQNKMLPGAYFQFVSKSAATAALAERGVAAMALELNWGPDNVIFDVEAADLQKNSMKIFGYDYTAKELQPIRELLCHAKKLYLYKLTSLGVKAENEFATAVCCGTRGNDLQVVIQKDVDNTDHFVVSLYLGTVKVDEQVVASAKNLVNNEYVTWNEAELVVTAGKPLTGGENGKLETTDDFTNAHQTFLNKIESYPDTNAIGYMGGEDAIKGMYTKFAERMRDEVGIKLQTVLFNMAADSVAVVNVKNSVYFSDGTEWGDREASKSVILKNALEITVEGTSGK